MHGTCCGVHMLCHSAVVYTDFCRNSLRIRSDKDHSAKIPGRVLGPDLRRPSLDVGRRSDLIDAATPAFSTPDLVPVGLIIDTLQKSRARRRWKLQLNHREIDSRAKTAAAAVRNDERAFLTAVAVCH